MFRRTGIATLELPDGVEWMDRQRGHLVVVLAPQAEEHLGPLRRLTRLMQQPETLAALMRAEFLFLERDDVPNEEEQYRVYHEMFEITAGRRLIIRTLAQWPAGCQRGLPRSAARFDDGFRHGWPDQQGCLQSSPPA